MPGDDGYTVSDIVQAATGVKISHQDVVGVLTDYFPGQSELKRRFREDGVAPTKAVIMQELATSCLFELEDKGFISTLPQKEGTRLRLRWACDTVQIPIGRSPSTNEWQWTVIWKSEVMVQRVGTIRKRRIPWFWKFKELEGILEKDRIVHIKSGTGDEDIAIHIRSTNTYNMLRDWIQDLRGIPVWGGKITVYRNFIS